MGVTNQLLTGMILQVRIVYYINMFLIQQLTIRKGPGGPKDCRKNILTCIHNCGASWILRFITWWLKLMKFKKRCQSFLGIHSFWFAFMLSLQNPSSFHFLTQGWRFFQHTKHWVPWQKSKHLQVASPPPWRQLKALPSDMRLRVKLNKGSNVHMWCVKIEIGYIELIVCWFFTNLNVELQNKTKEDVISMRIWISKMWSEILFFVTGGGWSIEVK